MTENLIFIIFLFILGAIFGSFLNCLIYRLKNEKTILGRSFCPYCKHQLGFLDLFPIFSYVFLKGKCRYCHRKIAIQYFLVEVSTGFIFAFGYWFYFMSNLGPVHNVILYLVFYLIINVFLIIIFIYDLKYYLVLDVVVWPAIIFSFLFNYFLLDIGFLNLLLAGSIGVLFFATQFIISRGRWLGSGDILIGLLLGFIVAWPRVLLVIFMSYVLGSIVGVFLLVFKIKKMSSKLPFGPFLVFSAWLTMLFGKIIMHWYVVQVLHY